MLDSRYFQDQVAVLEAGLKKRNYPQDEIASLVERSSKRKSLILEVEQLKAKRNQVTQNIAQLKAKSKTDPEAAKQADALVIEMRAAGDQIKTLDDELKALEEKFTNDLMGIPNLPDASVPEGKGAEDNVVVREWGKPQNYSFEPKDHATLGEMLGILDFERGGKISGARFTVYMGAGARLERALIQFMLDLHTSQHGYTEVITPFIVNRESMLGTGQLPKFEEDLFKTRLGDRDLYLIPTSEVSLTNLYRDEIIEPGKLPIHMTAYSPCFRSEAGSYGRDTRGLIRQHQFQKVEMVKITDQESSAQEHEAMVKNAEKVLEVLGLPYRTMLLCGGDMGFGSIKTYDLEVWLPSQKMYREISSCSNCGDFQARRAQIRYRTEPNGKPKLAHTLNGSGLAVGRTFLAILENFQDQKGHVKIPEALHCYVHGAQGFEKRGNELWLVGDLK
jgi:seryl-tRNA synthetase